MNWPINDGISSIESSAYFDPNGVSKTPRVQNNKITDLPDINQTLDAFDNAKEISYLLEAQDGLKEFRLPKISLEKGEKVRVTFKKELGTDLTNSLLHAHYKNLYTIYTNESTTYSATETTFPEITNYDKLDLSFEQTQQDHIQLSRALHEVISNVRETSSGNGGGGMDNLERRVENLERKVEVIDGRLINVEMNVALIKEQTKKLENIPTKTDMQQLISEALKSIPNEDRIKTIIRDEIKDLPDQYKTKDIVRVSIDEKKLVTDQTLALTVDSKINEAKKSMLKWGIAIIFTIVATSATVGTFLINFFKKVPPQ